MKTTITKNEAIAFFEECYASALSNSHDFDIELWKAHSYTVAEAASCLAAHSHKLVREQAFCCGLLHDIGKYRDARAKWHAIAGYEVLHESGYHQAALVALTHDFPSSDFSIHYEEQLVPPSILRRYETLLQEYQYSFYDRLIHICDLISLPEKCVFMEQRMLHAVLRYGALTGSLTQHIQCFYTNKTMIEALIGQPIYAVLPHIFENTVSTTPQ